MTITTHYDTTYYTTEASAARVANRWIASPKGQRFIEETAAPGAVLFTYLDDNGWDWGIRTGRYVLTSYHLNDEHTLDIFADADNLAAWLLTNKVEGDTADLIRRAVLGALPLMTSDASQQTLLFRLLLAVSPTTPDAVVKELLDDPCDLIAYHAMNRTLKLGGCDTTVTTAHALREELECDLLDGLEVA